LLLSSRLADEVEKESRVAMIATEIHSAATLGASLMRDVLSLSRPRTKLIERVAVNEVISERLGLIARLLGDTVEIQSVLDEGAGDVLVDRKRFEHAILNLVANARDAMPAGGRLTIATRLVDCDSGPSVTLAVTDTGVGMSDHVRGRAFDSFFTTKGDSGGTGIGLASVLRFARESGGLVTLDSELRKGTTVTLVLPRLAASEPVSAVMPARYPDVRNGNAKVLVADGNGTVSRAVQLALEARGYTVLLAASAEQALELASAHQPDIALVDAQLAHHDPRTFLHRLRAVSRSVRIVFLSVAPSDSGTSDFEISFLPKAFSDEELVGAVGDALACSG
jgi:CheY-like chemotaxis protein